MAILSDRHLAIHPKINKIGKFVTPTVTGPTVSIGFSFKAWAISILTGKNGHCFIDPPPELVSGTPTLSRS
jgi:hypothetical protein